MGKLIPRSFLLVLLGSALSRGYCSGVLAQWSCLRKARLEPWLAWLVCPLIVAAMPCYHPVAPVSFASLVQDWENVQEGIEATGFIGYPIRWIRGGVVSAPFRLESLSYPFLCLWQTGPMLWPVVGLPVWVAHNARCVCVGCGWKGAIACCVSDQRSCL